MTAMHWIIRAEKISKSFGTYTAVQELSLNIARGEIFGFLGPNGSGKSTTIRMLCGLLTPSSGAIEILGHQIPRDLNQLKQHIGYMTQKFSLYEDLSIQENLEFLTHIYGLLGAVGKRRIEELLERYWLKEQRKQIAGTLSGGQKQRLALAAATLHKPAILLLDEPTSAVDPESRRVFWDSLFELAETGTTLLVSTHYMEEAERCSRLGILDQGTLVGNAPPTELTQTLLGRSYLIDHAQPRQLQKILSQLPEIIATVQLGNSLRILTKQPGLNSFIENHLAQHHMPSKLSLVQPNLEDVFIHLTHKPSNHRQLS